MFPTESPQSSQWCNHLFQNCHHDFLVISSGAGDKSSCSFIRLNLWNSVIRKPFSDCRVLTNSSLDWRIARRCSIPVILDVLPSVVLVLRVLLKYCVSATVTISVCFCPLSSIFFQSSSGILMFKCRLVIAHLYYKYIVNVVQMCYKNLIKGMEPLQFYFCPNRFSSFTLLSNNSMIVLPLSTRSYCYLFISSFFLTLSHFK
jgi:hypothetical protein